MATKPSHYTRAQVCRILGLTASQLKVPLREAPDMLVEIAGTPMIPSNRVNEIPRIRKRLGLASGKEK